MAIRSGPCGEPPTPPPPAEDALAPGTRLLLAAFGALTFLAFVALFVLAAATDRYFAWTIEPPLTAAWLGAAYGAGCVLVLLGLRSGAWSQVRLPILTVLTFAVLTLAATLLHLDRFHFGSAGAVARPAAWFWTAVYVLAPLAMVAVVVQEDRRRGRPADSPATGVPIPRALAGALGAQAAVLATAGALLLVAPETAAAGWPWALTPLTARVVGAWLTAFGVGIALALRSGDLGRLPSAAVAYAVFGGLEMAVLARYPDEVRWAHPSAWGYVLVAAAVLASSLYALVRLARARGTGPGP